ncbi:MAG TPA: hypothetical protein VGI05_05320 [Streptosporangiaceae bacterium]|jgi:hypothetical protein
MTAPAIPAPAVPAARAALGLPGIAPGPGGYWGLTTTTVTGPAAPAVGPDLAALAAARPGPPPLSQTSARVHLDGPAGP